MQLGILRMHCKWPPQIAYYWVYSTQNVRNASFLIIRSYYDVVGEFRESGEYE